MAEIDDFLKERGMRPDHNHWDKVIQPNSSYLIVGDVGTGKSALAYYLLETYSQKYDLLPAVVGLPRDKEELLPPNFIILDSPSECARLENAIVFIDEADLQLPLEDTKARQYVVNFLSLPRHRKQIFLLAFHFPRLVLGRYLPFFSAFLLKRPPYLIEFAGKRRNDATSQMMERAEERFSELPSEDVVKNTYVVAPRIRWQGMLSNPLCSFWKQELSEVWAGTGVEKKVNLDDDNLRITGGKAAPPAVRIKPTYGEGVIVGFEVHDPTGKVIRPRSSLAEAIHERFPEVSKEEVVNAQIGYEEHAAYIVLPGNMRRD